MLSILMLNQSTKLELGETVEQKWWSSKKKKVVNRKEKMKFYICKSHIKNEV